MSVLPSIAGCDLPPLAYAHDTDHDTALTVPERFRPIANKPGFNLKPSGGMWTSPVTESGLNGLPTWTEWIDWCHSEDWGADHYAHLTEILPDPAARVLRINQLRDLVAIVDAHCCHDAELSRVAPSKAWRYPNWAALAADGWDAVYLTDAGQWATRFPPDGQPDLYGWDCATVLWLRPAYTVGRTGPVVESGARTAVGGEVS